MNTVTGWGEPQPFRLGHFIRVWMRLSPFTVVFDYAQDDDGVLRMAIKRRCPHGGGHDIVDCDWVLRGFRRSG
jgi:hypothetical protein